MSAIGALGKELVIFACLILGVIALIVFFELLNSIGLASAVILGIGGLLLIALIGALSPPTLENHATLLLCIVVFLIALGFVSDHVKSLSMIAPATWIGTGSATQMSMTGAVASYIMTPMALGILVLVIIVLLLFIVVFKRRRR